MSHPILYSYRRCPYAMRARMAIWASDLVVEQREIVFWDKPDAMLSASPKGTVPVLVLPDGQVIDESRDIMFWALEHSQALALHDWCPPEMRQGIVEWLEACDGDFKPYLDHYKYPDQFPEIETLQARQAGEQFLQVLEDGLSQQGFLIGERVTLADIGIFPFVRQFAQVDIEWFESTRYEAVKGWLAKHKQADCFLSVMKNRPVWEEGHHPLWVNEPDLMRKDQMRAKALGLPQPRK